MIPLRDYQQETIDKLRNSLRANRRSILCAVTGAGKTRMAKWMLDQALQREPDSKQTGKMLVCVHRRGLVENLSDELNRSPKVPHGMIMAGCDTHGGRRVQCASIDTLNSWYLSSKYDGPLFDMIIFDECHSHVSKLAALLEGHETARADSGLTPTYLIGLSATPEAKGLGDVFNDIVYGPPASWLQANGYAAKYRYMSGKKGDLSKLKKRGGDYTNKSVTEAMEGLAGAFVRDWKQYAGGRPTIGFFPRLSQAREAQEQLIANGIKAEYVDGKTPDEERRQLFAGLGAGDYDYLCNVGVTERGTDIPAVACTQLCVSVGRKSRYLQMIGRGSRPAEGKLDNLVLDHGGNISQPGGNHGFWEDDHEWVLTHETNDLLEAAKRPTIECPSCQAIYRGGKCKQCGYEPTAKERKSQGLEFTGSELKEYTKKTRKKKTKTCEEILIASLYRAAYSGRTWKQACGMAIGEAKKQGTKMRVPMRFTIAGREYKSIPYGDPDGQRRVADIYPFMVRR